MAPMAKVSSEVALVAGLGAGASVAMAAVAEAAATRTAQAIFLVSVAVAVDGESAERIYGTDFGLCVCCFFLYLWTT